MMETLVLSQRAMYGCCLLSLASTATRRCPASAAERLLLSSSSLLAYSWSSAAPGFAFASFAGGGAPFFAPAGALAAPPG